MPIYTVYARIIQRGKRKTHRVRNTAVYTFYSSPLDWSDLKSTLLDTARKIYYDHNQQLTSDISLEKHLAGRYKTGKTSYRVSRIHYRRQPEFNAKISYNHHQDIVKVENASFITPEFYQFKFDYDLERQKKFTMQKLVPADFEAGLLNNNLLWVENLTLKTPTYLQDPKDLYASHQAQRRSPGMYAGRNIGMYAPRNVQTLEVDRQEKEGQH